MKGSKIVVLVMLAAIGSWVCGCTSTAPTATPEKKTTIRWASPFKPGHTLVETGNKFKEIVEKGSGGRLAVEVQAGVGSEEDINDWCSQGKVEMQVVIPDADSLREKGKPAVEQLFKTEWPVTTWAEVLAQ